MAKDEEIRNTGFAEVSGSGGRDNADIPQRRGMSSKDIHQKKQIDSVREEMEREDQEDSREPEEEERARNEREFEEEDFENDAREHSPEEFEEADESEDYGESLGMIHEGRGDFNAEDFESGMNDDADSVEVDSGGNIGTDVDNEEMDSDWGQIKEEAENGSREVEPRAYFMGASGDASPSDVRKDARESSKKKTGKKVGRIVLLVILVLLVAGIAVWGLVFGGFKNLFGENDGADDGGRDTQRLVCEVNPSTGKEECVFGERMWVCEDAENGKTICRDNSGRVCIDEADGNRESCVTPDGRSWHCSMDSETGEMACEFAGGVGCLVDEKNGDKNCMEEDAELTGLLLRVSYSEVFETGNDVVVRITGDEAIMTDAEGWENSDDDGLVLEKVFGENTNERVLVKSETEEQEILIDVRNINKDLPSAIVSFSTTDPTNKEVTATIKTDKDCETPKEWTRVSAREFTRSFSENTELLVKITVAGGNNVINVPVSISWIDKAAPTAEVSYSTTSPTNGNVTVTVRTNEPVGTPRGWTRHGVMMAHFTRVYSDNVDETLSFTDLAGNRGTVQIRITNIDRVAPTGQVSYSTTAATNKDVTATVTTSKDVNTPSGWNHVSARQFTRVFSGNANEEVSFSDAAGNTGSARIVIANIDKIPPSLLGDASATCMGGGERVSVRITTSEAVETPSEWIREADTMFKREFALDGSGTINGSVALRDIVGNTSNPSFVVDVSGCLPPGGD